MMLWVVAVAYGAYHPSPTRRARLGEGASIRVSSYRECTDSQDPSTQNPKDYRLIGALSPSNLIFFCRFFSSSLGLSVSAARDPGQPIGPIAPSRLDPDHTLSHTLSLSRGFSVIPGVRS